MSVPFTPERVFLFASFLYRSDQISISRVREMWSEVGGCDICIEAPHAPMNEYYSREMCQGTTKDFLERIVIVSEKLCPREELVNAKKWANKMENSLAVQDRRLVNIDVGYVSLENMVLATNKPFAHRILLQEGLYADLNYIYKAGQFEMLPWTYPDYARPEIIDFFHQVRDNLKRSLRLVQSDVEHRGPQF